MKSLSKCKDTMATVVGGFVFVGNQPCMKWVSRYPHPSPIKKWTESTSIHTPFPTKNYVSVLLLTPPSAFCLPNDIKNLWLSYKAVYSFLWTKYLKQRHIKIIVLTSVKKYPKIYISKSNKGSHQVWLRITSKRNVDTKLSENALKKAWTMNIVNWTEKIFVNHRS